MTKREREQRHRDLIIDYSARSLADLVIELEEHCEKQDREMAKLRAKIRELESR